MKTRILVLFLFLPFFVIAQTDKDKADFKKIPNKIKNLKIQPVLKNSKLTIAKDQLKEILKFYRPTDSNDKIPAKESIIVQPKLLDNRLTKAFNQVVLGGSDLVDNAYGVGINQNEDNGTVSINTDFRLSKPGKHELFLTTGANASGSGSIFELYSDNAWRTSIGADIGLIWKFSGSGYSHEKQIGLQQNKSLRRAFIIDSVLNRLVSYKLSKYKELRDSFVVISDDINGIRPLPKPFSKKKKKSTELKKIIGKLNMFESFFLKAENSIYKIKKRYVVGQVQRQKNNQDKDTPLEKRYLQFTDYKNVTENGINDFLIEKLLMELWSKKEDGNNFIKNYFKDIAIVFDEKNIKNTGYSFHWFHLKLGARNNAYVFSENAKNIESGLLPAFNIRNKDSKKKRLNTSLKLNYNYSLNTKNKGALYIQGGVGLHSGSFLNSNLIDGTAKVADTLSNGQFLIKDEKDKLLGTYDNIDHVLQYGSFDGYIAYYFGKRKMFGFNLNVNQRYGLKTPQGSFYPNNYSVLFGPIFRKPEKDDDTGVTFSIDVGVDNAPHISRAKDFFVTRIRVGIPLKLFNINKT